MKWVYVYRPGVMTRRHISVMTKRADVGGLAQGQGCETQLFFSRRDPHNRYSSPSRTCIFTLSDV